MQREQEILHDHKIPKLLCSRHSVPRRKQLKKHGEIPVVRETSDPVDGLEAMIEAATSAAAKAKEVRPRGRKEQRERCEALAEPRVRLPVAPASPWSFKKATIGNFSERLQDLSKPRGVKAQCDDSVSSSKAAIISESMQRRRANELTKPRNKRLSLSDILDEMSMMENLSLEERLLAQAERSAFQKCAIFT